ncbi:MAG TPA: ABC transporter ATP-binding protein [Erysipelothrix sp.]|nr:ABC transporter ATP-binding protein [Erysipelothrix sp.]
MKKTLYKSLPYLLLAALIGLIGSLFQSAMSLMMMDVIDLALAGEVSQLTSAAKGLFLFLFLSIPINVIKVLTRTQYTKKTMLNLKSYYLSKLFDKDINEFQEENNGRYLSNLTNDMESIEQKYTLSILDLVLGVIDFLVALLLLAYIQKTLVIIAIAVGVVIGGLSVFSGKPLQKPEGEKSKRLTKYTEYIKEILGAFAIIKNNNLEQRITTNFKDYSNSVQQKNYDIDKKFTYINAIQQLFMFALMIGGLAYVIYLAASESFISAGGLILVFNNFGRVVGPIFQLTEITPKIASVNLLFKEMDDILENKSTYRETLSLSNLTEGIIFTDVAYDYGENLVFENANITFEVGKKYLIIGPSGQGKSTLLKLLRKYFAPTNGQILIDNQNFVETKKLDVFSQLANIEQQVFLFEDTLKNNITLYKDYTQQEILDAINKGGLTNVVNEFSDGLDHMILDNGKNVSGGQKARIAIARGLITKARIILLDEAFASLDETVAKQIEQTLLSLDNVMVINVSHVVFKDSMAQYDKVYVVNNQQILPLEV